jgi:FkbM family methyltransferase
VAHRHPAYPFFTIWICERGILREPFRLVDVGVLGGIQDHWWFFGEYLEAWGFDALYEEGIEPLIAGNRYPERIRYFNFGVGEADGERPFHLVKDNPSSSSFMASNVTDVVQDDFKMIKMRSLDSLMADGTLAAIDFMKMDAERYEPQIIRGAAKFLLCSGIFGIESEVSFFRTARNPRSQFVDLYEELAPYGFTVYDAGVQRNPRAPLIQGFPKDLGNERYALQSVGQSWVLDMLFFSPIFDSYKLQEEANPDRLLKLIATAELYGLPDVALDVLFANQYRLSHRIDIEEAANLLIREQPESTLTYQRYRRDLIECRCPLDKTFWIFPDDLYTSKFSYEGRGQTTSIIPPNLGLATRNHGAGIMRVSPRVEPGCKLLRFRTSINCYGSEEDTTVVLAVYQDEEEEAVALISEPLPAGRNVVLEKEFLVPVGYTWPPPVFDIRVGVAPPGGTLSLNYDPIKDIDAAGPSYIEIHGGNAADRR